MSGDYLPVHNKHVIINYIRNNICKHQCAFDNYHYYIIII